MSRRPDLARTATRDRCGGPVGRSPTTAEVAARIPGCRVCLPFDQLALRVKTDRRARDAPPCALGNRVLAWQ